MIGLLLGAVTRPRYATVVFDVDSTVAAIEGIDWLAALRGSAIAHECASLTTRAMAGELPLEEVYLQRLRAIAPTTMELDQLGEAYLATVQPGAAEVIAALQAAGTSVHLLSGGLRHAILPLAKALGVAPDHVHAVSLLTNAEQRFVALDGDQPLATQRGKPLVLSRLPLTHPTVLIGDGSTDAAARGVVDRFIAYTGVARRAAVVAVADAEAADFHALHALLFEPAP